MNWLLHVVLLLPLASAEQASFESKTCVAYGKCTDQWNCANSTSPVAPSFDVSDFCPELAGRPLCCAEDQFAKLKQDLNQAAVLFARCEACMMNFRLLWCSFTCSPSQSTFRAVTSAEPCSPDDPGDHRQCERAGSYTIEKAFSLKIEKSCKTTIFPATGQTVFEFFKWASYREWYTFMGSPGLGSPFPIAFLEPADDDTTTPRMNLTDSIIPCNHFLHGCSCADCPSNCGGASCESEPPNWEVGPGERWDVFGHSLSPYTAIAYSFVLFLLLGPIVYFGVNPTRLTKRLKPVRADAITIIDSGELDSGLAHFFFNLGWTVASSPWTTIAVSVTLVSFISAGALNLELMTDPVELWAADGSPALADLNRFDETFSPFFRVNQVFVRRTDNQLIVNAADLLAVRDFQETLMRVTAHVENGDPITFSNLCHRPIRGEGCLMQSPLEYWAAPDPFMELTPNSTDDDVVAAVEYCTKMNSERGCRGSIGAVIFPWVVFGGYPRVSSNYTQSSHLVLTFLLDNDASASSAARAWEAAWLKVVRRGLPGFELSFHAERSVEDELTRESSGDLIAVVVSYVAMFIYVAVAMGSMAPCRCHPRTSLAKVFIHTKFFLSFSGIAVVLLSVAASVGVCATLGVRITLIISEVIPFLVLAIGVDNMFIIMDRFHINYKNCSIEERMALALSQVGKSILLAAVSEMAAFMLAALTRMPAVQAFAWYAATAVFFNFVLQITLFIALAVIDARRLEQSRCDCCPCFVVAESEADSGTPLQASIPSPAKKRSSREVWDSRAQTVRDASLGDSALRTALVDYWVPTVLHPACRLGTVAAFLAASVLCTSFVINKSVVGLDQKVALPNDSYLQGYFFDVENTLRVGPPLYFVVEGGDLTDPMHQNRLCTSSNCNCNSLGAVVQVASKRPETTYISQPASSWIDDYFQWLANDVCCRKNATGSYCPPPDQGGSDECTKCMKVEDWVEVPPQPPFERPYWRPRPARFTEYLPWFLDSVCSTHCGTCGSAHSTDVIVDPANGKVVSSRFMAYHSVLGTDQEFSKSLEGARMVSDTLKASVGDEMRVYVYSKHHVFFEQYLFIAEAAVVVVGVALCAILILSAAVLYQLPVASMVFLTVLMIVVDVAGLMSVWDININAVSVVNLAMCVGMSVEFCIHIATAFLASRGTSFQRVQAAFAVIGAPAFQGVFLTSLIGVGALYFAQSQIFEIYYFRKYLLIISVAGAHGFWFFPALLGLFGPDCPNTKQGNSNSDGPRHDYHLMAGDGEGEGEAPPPGYGSTNWTS